MTIGERIKELRKEKGVSQMKLAKEIGYTQPAINDWEIGKRRPIIDAVIALAQFFDVSSDYLWGVRARGRLKSQKQL